MSALRCLASGDSATLALVDLDGFRRVNEEAGQPGGDRALREVAALFAAQLGPGEHLVRLGGEEFVLLLRKPMGTAWEHMEALRRTLAGRGFIAERGGERLPLTFPCDPDGRVDLDHLSEAARNDYFYARALVGRHYDAPRMRTYWPDPISTKGAQKYGSE